MEHLPKEFTVLVVEDQEGHREASNVILRPICHVLSTQTALAAIEVIRRETVDLVIEDDGLPDMNGIDLLRKIRALQPGIVIIMMSGAGTVQSAEDAMGLGAIAYLLKPFNFQEVVLLVQEAKAHLVG